MGSYVLTVYRPRRSQGLLGIAGHALSDLVHVIIVLIWFSTASHAPNFLLCSMS